MSGLALVVAVAVTLLWDAPAVPAQTAADLIAKVLAAQQTRGFTLRARLVTTSTGKDEPAVVQVRMLGRRDDTATRVLYQALWPASLKGHAIYVEHGRSQSLRGFLFEPPDTVTPLTRERLSAPLFDSELGLDDVAEEYWAWPNPVETGEDVVEGQRCRVIELRAPPGARSNYAAVRGCVSESKMLPLRVEKIGRDGSVARRFTVKKTMKGESGRWAPVATLIETAGTTRTTMLEVSRGEADVTVPVEEFSLPKIKSLGK